MGICKLPKRTRPRTVVAVAASLVAAAACLSWVLVGLMGFVGALALLLAPIGFMILTDTD